jgi:hypothetical protein
VEEIVEEIEEAVEEAVDEVLDELTPAHSHAPHSHTQPNPHADAHGHAPFITVEEPPPVADDPSIFYNPGQTWEEQTGGGAPATDGTPPPVADDPSVFFDPSMPIADQLGPSNTYGDGGPSIFFDPSLPIADQLGPTPENLYHGHAPTLEPTPDGPLCSNPPCLFPPGFVWGEFDPENPQIFYGPGVGVGVGAGAGPHYNPPEGDVPGTGVPQPPLFDEGPFFDPDDFLMAEDDAPGTDVGASPDRRGEIEVAPGLYFDVAKPIEAQPDEWNGFLEYMRIVFGLFVV